MFGLTAKEHALLKSLNTPKKIQDYLEHLPINFEPKGDTCLSPRCVMREHKAHCMEGAMFAALALRFQGYQPLVVDLKSTGKDDDHVIAVYKKNDRWGAISKTNHVVLRYREPIYANIRELVMSYFHEYFTIKGDKSLRSYSNPLDLSRFDKRGWITAEKDVFYIPNYLDKTPHIKILTKTTLKSLRKTDSIELGAGDLVDWKRDKKARYGARKIVYHKIINTISKK